MDKATRNNLTRRFLDAETTLEEERQLRDWFATHPADEDERELALLIGLSAPCGHCLPETEETDAEFDRIVESGEKRKRRKRAWWSAGVGTAAAAVVAALLWLLPARTGSAELLTPLQIAEGIQQMMLLDIGDIESVVAEPAGSRALLTVRLKDGNTCSYILTYNEDEGTASLLAYTNP